MLVYFQCFYFIITGNVEKIRKYSVENKKVSRWKKKSNEVNNIFYRPQNLKKILLKQVSPKRYQLF